MKNETIQIGNSVLKFDPNVQIHCDPKCEKESFLEGIRDFDPF